MNITKDIIYIGQDDKETTLFESQYMLEAGMCYNSYLINDDKIAIMDTSDQRTFEAWLEDLKNALNGRKPDYLVVQHLEPDHTGGVEEVHAMLHVEPRCELFEGQVARIQQAEKILLGMEDVQGASIVFKRYFLSDATNQVPVIQENDARDF